MKKQKVLKPAMDKEAKGKAKKMGYDDDYADRIGGSNEISKKGKKPVAKDTNKTRRKMVKPTKKSSYA